MVLQPEWLTKAIGYVLEDRGTRNAGGLLEHSRLRELWTPPRGEGYQPRYHPYFVRLMEKFDVSYRITDEPASLVGQLVPY
jgi:internalin A